MSFVAPFPSYSAATAAAVAAAAVVVVVASSPSFSTPLRIFFLLYFSLSFSFSLHHHHLLARSRLVSSSSVCTPPAASAHACLFPRALTNSDLRRNVRNGVRCSEARLSPLFFRSIRSFLLGDIFVSDRFRGFFLSFVFLSRIEAVAPPRKNREEG